MRQKIEEKFLQLVRFYTFNTPILKGRFRIYQTALRVCREGHRSMPVEFGDGRRFVANLTNGMQDTLYFVGEIERVLTDISRQLIDEGDVCIDGGANFGWYTSLMMAKCGAGGEVHAFEPTPGTFRELRRNYEFWGSPTNVFINNAALGDRNETVLLHVFEGMVNGYASLAGREDTNSMTLECPMIDLDRYLEDEDIRQVDFVKVDIEGAELMFLKGAARLFKQAAPPIILMEMATAQSANFGYHPNDLIEFIRSCAGYDFYAIDEYNGTARLIDRFAADDIGANVFCIPETASDKKKAVLRSMLIN